MANEDIDKKYVFVHLLGDVEAIIGGFSSRIFKIGKQLFFEIEEESAM